MYVQVLMKSHRSPQKRVYKINAERGVNRGPETFCDFFVSKPATISQKRLATLTWRRYPKARGYSESEASSRLSAERIR